MVIFKKHVSHAAAEAHHSWIQDLHLNTQTSKQELRKRSSIFSSDDDLFEGLRHTFNIPGGLLGYAGHFDQDVIEQVRRHPDVDYIERDSEVHTMKESPSLEKNAPWGLARISHRDALGFGDFNKYLYTESGGEVLMHTSSTQAPTLSTLTSKAVPAGERPFHKAMKMLMETDTEPIALVLLPARNSVLQRRPTSTLSRF